MYAHTNYLSLDIHRETDLFLVVLAFINIFYLSSVIHPDGEGTLYYWSLLCKPAGRGNPARLSDVCLSDFKKQLYKKLQLHR